LSIANFSLHEVSHKHKKYNSELFECVKYFKLIHLSFFLRLYYQNGTKYYIDDCKQLRDRCIRFEARKKHFEDHEDFEQVSHRLLGGFGVGAPKPLQRSEMKV
jgi:hypothetical protein